jgi:SAM-dependent methyltransferase
MTQTDARTTIAGLQVTWQEFHAARLSLWERPATRQRREPGEGEASFGLWVPDDPDGLLDGMTQEEFERSDERMPYFSAIWPSAESLVAKVLCGQTLTGRHVLDLGCGLGPCGFAAARRGAHVTFFDWEPRALELVAASACAGGWPGDAFDMVVGDWREPPPFGPFDLILGADVLYERRNGPAVAGFLSRHLKPGAEAWITDPGRPQAVLFPPLARDVGLDLLSTELLPPEPHGFDVTLFRIAI